MTTSPAVDPALAFRATMSRLPSGVSVITTRFGDAPIGMTASAVTALSLDPVQLLVCVGNHLFTKRAIAQHGRFGVNVLGEDSQELAKRFAAKGDRFAGVDYDEDHGVPMLRDAIAGVVCEVAGELPGGDHTIFVGSARQFGHRSAGRPLLHFCGEFGRIA
ncbi:flavin reductase family protein [Amycolatopsis mongoliensis]|uniref:Flavin reductase family protein n=1 Tax=Amycolatopsis mongoliensis TaxID=715475 RepID=A0A9Y2JP99_9PSEU|nr:flavin reductase family protein [Amycolatopsis sp. 4-36]WIY00999.1 flavin reductase family protein [Amycolatopsis sp. 4-36]